jgi:hypothetical protein
VSSRRVRGPDQWTIPERIIGLTRLPYALGCLVTALVAGGPGTFLLFYIGTFNGAWAWQSTVSVSVFSVLPLTQHVSAAEGVAEVAVTTLALFLDMYLIRYLRLKVLATEPKLSPLAPGGEIAFRRAFGPMAQAGGSVAFTIVFLLAYLPARALIAGHALVPLVGITALSIVAFSVYGAAFWVYLSCVWGVFRFGGEPLNLNPFYEDRMLGLRPLGQIVVWSAGIFTLAITVTLGASLITGDVASLSVNIVIVATGVSMLFLPLLGIHGRMAQLKEEEEAKLGPLRRELLSPLTIRAANDPEQALSTKIDGLVGLQSYLTLRDEVSKIASWPFETQTVERLVAVLLAVFTVLMTRLLELAH